MDIKSIMNAGRNIYEHMMDPESRYIYKERLLFSLTGDVIHAQNIVRTTEEGRWFSNLIDTDSELYIFGAGIWGQLIAHTWPIGWKGFLDNDSKKWGTYLGNVPILNLQNILQEPFHGKVLISSQLYYREICNQLKELGVPTENIINIWGGETLDRLAEKQYFALDDLPHNTNEVFVDVGSLDAMTAVHFIKWSQNQFEKIYCFEPDMKNIPKCEKTLCNYMDRYKGQIEIIGKGAWSDTGKLAFISQGNGGSAINRHTENVTDDWIDVIALDEFFEDRKVSFIKMDIEGAELEAIKGCRELIRKQKPKLAICIYHKPEDILTLPQLILQLNPDYKLYLRHYSIAAVDTVLYAV